MQDTHQVAQTAAEATQADANFIGSAEMVKRLGVSYKTLCRWRARGIVPSIEVGSKVLYHWPSVETALLRLQRVQ